MAANDGDNPIGELFPGWGITAPAGTGAPGTGHSSASPGPHSGAGDVGNRNPFGGAQPARMDTAQNGQTAGLPGMPAAGEYTDSGAGHGGTIRAGNHPNAGK